MNGVLKRTKDRLVEALIKANAPAEMLENARNGVYDDFESEIANPISVLVADARIFGLEDIAKRAINGEFDCEKWEAEQWASSPEGQQVFKQLTEKEESMKQSVTKQKPSFKRHHDDEWFDEVRITTVPRFKMSGLSGDEWRTSARVEILRKGFVLWSQGFRDIVTAAAFLPTLLITPFENGEALDPENDNEKCFQPGCSNRYVAEYRYKKVYCNDGHATDPIFDSRIRFCEKHLRRGDCGLEDADDNYEVVSGPGPEKAKGWGSDISESV